MEKVKVATNNGVEFKELQPVANSIGQVGKTTLCDMAILNGMIEKGYFENVADIKEMVVPDKITVTRQAIIGETIERPLPKQYKKNSGVVNKDRRNIAEATKLLGIKSRKAFKKFAKKLRVNQRKTLPELFKS